MRDIRTLDLNLLKAFEALLDEQSVTRAADRLSVTQPAMSAMLNRLRESFDDPLFVRVQHGIRPTDRAAALGAEVKTVLAHIGKMLQPPEFDPQTARMKISLASTDYGLQAVAVPFVAKLKQLAPHIQVVLLPIQDSNVRSLLEQGRLDIALISPERIHSDEVHIRPLYHEHYVCTLRAGHPAAAQPLNLDRFCGLDFALMSYDGGGFSGSTDEALAKLGRSRKVSVSVSNFLLMPEILRRSDMAAMLPARLARGQEGLVSLPPPLDITGFTMAMAWHERTHRDLAHQWLRGLLAESALNQYVDAV